MTSQIFSIRNSVMVMQYEYDWYTTHQYQPKGLLEVPIADQFESLALLFARIEAKYDVEIEHVKFLGSRVKQDDENMIGSIVLDCQQKEDILSIWTIDSIIIDKYPWMSSANTRRAYRNLLAWNCDINVGNLVVFVRCYFGGNYTLTIKVQDYYTIENVKQIIEVKTGTPAQLQSLVFQGRRLEDQSTIKQNNISALSTLHAILPLKGGKDARIGVDFVDVTNQQSRQLLPYIIDGPEWRTVIPGINIEGYCKNQNCAVYSQLVIDPKGLCKVDIVGDKFKCPLCSDRIDPVTVGLRDCEWCYIGIKADEAQRIGCPYQDSNEKYYERFCENKNMIIWVQLVLAAKEKPELTTECSICLESLRVGEIYRGRCGHRFHTKCVQKYQRAKKASSISCPVCRRKEF
eukprot:TRINITY_DN22385_c0_g1_i1.p1 TRINITY_DN22385_c0_g1~~TRINITY_DN22385_c0_g1_i1.p1  ORF type:complete len:403 (+),score=28.94 TRINITY_DN22385_c0_g1_i1:127-1335(+)